MRIRSQRDFVSGLVFMGVGVAFAWGASDYSMGSGARMGPGYFPRVLGILLAAIGTLVAFKALVVPTVDGDRIGRMAWKPLFFIIAANLVFGVMLGGLPSLGLPAMGLIAGIYALTAIASLAGDAFNWKAVGVLGSVLAGLSYLAFVVLLKLQFPVWPVFITG